MVLSKISVLKPSGQIYSILQDCLFKIFGLNIVFAKFVGLISPGQIYCIFQDFWFKIFKSKYIIVTKIADLKSFRLNIYYHLRLLV